MAISRRCNALKFKSQYKVGFLTYIRSVNIITFPHATYLGANWRHLAPQITDSAITAGRGAIINTLSVIRCIVAKSAAPSLRPLLKLAIPVEIFAKLCHYTGQLSRVITLFKYDNRYLQILWDKLENIHLSFLWLFTFLHYFYLY